MRGTARRSPVERAVVGLCLVVVLVGALLRLTSLGTKLYTNDEATTSVHVAGQTLPQYADAMFDGRIRTVAQVLAFQRPGPGGPAGITAALASDDPQHPPLSYLLQAGWERLFGDAIAQRRAVAAIAGVLAILAAAWFAAELGGALAGAIGGALVAASPFALLYAQVAREYSLWTLTTCVASALLLRATRDPRPATWIAYALACIAGWYGALLFGLVLLAHAIALPFLARDRRRVVAGFAAALAATVLAFAPWLVAVGRGLTHGLVTNNAYLANALPAKLFALKWIFDVGALFYDLDFLRPKSAVVIVPGLLALAVAFVYAVREVRARRPLAVPLALACVTVVATVVPDLLHHESRSTSARYLVPLWAACDALLAVVTAAALRAGPARRILGMAFLGYAIVAGFASFAVSRTHESWWIDGSVRPVGPMARAIDAAPNPLVLYRATWAADGRAGDRWDFTVVELADRLRPDDHLAQYPRGARVPLPAWLGSIFLLDPTPDLRASLEAEGARLTEIATDDTTTDPEIVAARANAHDARRTPGDASDQASLWRVTPP